MVKKYKKIKFLILLKFIFLIISTFLLFIGIEFLFSLFTLNNFGEKYNIYLFYVMLGCVNLILHNIIHNAIIKLSKVEEESKNE